jgi:2-polyprenyl-3-methyl-5-hydroxy-6-metoxy-1,4-benzoquinol methylase
MADTNLQADHPELSAETRDIWNANAKWWDERIGDGNDFQNYLIEPASEALLEIAPGDDVLDVACGAGRFTRRMAELGARVTAFDQADAFIERARQRSKGLEIDFRVLDAGENQALEQLPDGGFDKAVCTMALMDMPDVEPLFRHLKRLLRPGGCFVFTVTHPCFHSAGVASVAEQSENTEGRLTTRSGIKIFRYLTPFARKSEGILGQPVPQYVFHRPLHVLLGYGFRYGLAVDGLLEPRLPELETLADVSWRQMTELPPVMAVRMRRT